MILENKYLKKAVEKAGFVIIVKTCNLNNRESKLEYISSNAKALGMNVELLNKGLKLTEDYIHPEDRAKVITAVKKAVDSKITEYAHEYRMVGDDGVLYNVSNEISVTVIDAENVSVEFYIRKADSSDKKRIAKQSNSSASAKAAPVMTSDLKDNMQQVMKAYSNSCGLYSAYVDMDGKIIYPPTGPATNLGDFYDLFEKPAYKEYYKYIKQVVEESDEPEILNREEGGIGKIAPAPIKIDGEIQGIWILSSYTQEETDMLVKINEDRWMIAQIISDYLQKSQIVEVEVAKSKGAGKKLREELARQGIINDALTKVNSSLIDSADEVIAETLREVGINLDIDIAVLYTYDKNKEFGLRSYWNVKGEAPGTELVDYYPTRRLVIEEGLKKDINKYTLDAATATQEDKINLMKYNFKACITYPIYDKDKLKGLLLFANTRADRTWTKEELRFSKSIGIVIEKMLENADSDDNIRNVNQHLIETYNNFNVGIFVRNAKTGEVLFSNKAMNEMMGKDFAGGNSREILTDLHDRFDNIDGMRKPFIKQEVASWRSYIQKMDAIMDITEVKMEWLSGEPANLVILRKASDDEFIKK